VTLDIRQISIDFSQVQLLNVCDINNGYAFKSTLFKSEGVPLLRISNIDNDRVTFGERTVYLDESYLSEYKKFVVNKGDVVIALSGATTGKYGIYELDTPCLLNQRIGIIRSGKSEKLESRYFYFYLRELKSEILRKAQGAAQPNISTKDIGQLKIPLPPLAEQQKIAAILDAADSLRQKDRQLIDHYTALSQSLFLEMFGDPVTNPMGWERHIADKYIDLLTGFAFKSKDYSNNKGDIHLCGGLIITPSGIEWSKANFWKRDALEGLEKYKVMEGDIVMAMDRPWISSGFKIHKITKCDEESFLVQRTARIRGKNINQDFLYFLYKHSAFEKQASTTETTVPHISPNDIRKYELIIPPLDLQNQFAERVQLIEQQKQQAQASLEKSEALFNSLLQRAFTGELTGKI
jgi:type I restriction enzyme S subunit